MSKRILTLALLALSLAVVPAAQADFDITHFDGELRTESGSAVAQAGSRPFAATAEIRLATVDVGGEMRPDGSVKDFVVDLPPGIVGDFTQLPRCSTAEILGMVGETAGVDECPIDSQVGVLKVYLGGDESEPLYSPIYNMEPPLGTPADFAAPVAQALVVRLTPSVRTGSDYGLRVSSLDTSSLLPIFGTDAEFWGVPSDASHDRDRYPCLHPTEGPSGNKCPVTFPRFPLLTMPTSCTGPLEMTLSADSWQDIGAFKEASVLTHDSAGDPYGLHGCALLGFAPSLVARPDTKAADSPSGFHFNLHVPQNDNPDGNATAHLRDVEVALPKGLTVNPSSATGLAGCTSVQIELAGPDAANCPNASKIGTVSVSTPLIEDSLEGAMYVAEPFDNPFGSLIALYISVDDPRTGVVVKLAGEVMLGPGGQITTVFEQNPQLPFEDLDVDLFGGPRASLRTPTLCGSYTTRYALTPWSAPAAPVAKGADAFQVTSGPNGSPCAHSEGQKPNSPSFAAGTAFPLAASHSPFVLDLSREDGSKELSGIEATLPPGLAAKFAGVPYCSEATLAAAESKTGKAEQASPSCPAASRVGEVTVGAGAGPQPYRTKGAAYLSGPYKGAPLSISVITPAVAGPFDLGVVVVRTAIHVDPTTAQGRAVSDPIPTELEGIPLDVRSVELALDRPEFTLNPTNCEPMAIGGSILAQGASVGVSSPFQVGGCRNLDFKPRMTMRLLGGSKRGDFPKFRTVLVPRPGDANIAAASVRLPGSAFLEQGHIRTICTRVQFKASTCPKGSIYGQAVAHTPLLDNPVSGPVYLRSSDNKLPDLVFALRGQIAIDAVARIDSVKGAIRATLDVVPDAPVSKFVLNMQGGEKGLIVNSRNLCEGTAKATAKFVAHSGHRVTLRPLVKPQCGKGSGTRRGSRR
jgi:hypothetical protein